MQKRFSVKKINFKSETETFNVKVDQPIPKNENNERYSPGDFNLNK
jgi:hypothetical protein